jgi:hypothetical protein
VTLSALGQRLCARRRHTVHSRAEVSRLRLWSGKRRRLARQCARDVETLGRPADTCVPRVAPLRGATGELGHGSSRGLGRRCPDQRRVSGGHSAVPERMAPASPLAPQSPPPPAALAPSPSGATPSRLPRRRCPHHRPQAAGVATRYGTRPWSSQRATVLGETPRRMASWTVRRRRSSLSGPRGGPPRHHPQPLPTTLSLPVRGRSRASPLGRWEAPDVIAGRGRLDHLIAPRWRNPKQS